MSVATLAGTTWIFDSSISLPGGYTTYYLSYTSNSHTFNIFDIEGSEIYYVDTSGGEPYAVTVYANSAWSSTAYRTIEIIDGTDVTNANLIAWLEANAEQQLPDIDYLTTTSELTSVANAIRTKGGTSASLVYPTGFVTAIQNLPAGTMQTKSVTYTSNNTYTVTPDSGYDGLSQVSVTVAIPVWDGNGTIT